MKSDAPPEVSGLRVLYLEDDPADADMACLSLRAADPGITIDLVKTLAEASARLDAMEAAAAGGAVPAYDAMLLDMRLPDGNGLDILTRLRRRSLPVAVVVLTGSGDEEAALNALRSGADDYLTKRPEYWTSLPGALRTAVGGFQSRAALRMRSLRLLYIEHNPSDVEITRRHLAVHAPYIHFDSASSSQAGLVKLATSGYDVILTDFLMPSMDALELLKEIRARGLGIPVVVITGQGSEETAIQAIKLGAMDYLVKSPGYLGGLPLVVERAFYQREVEREKEALAASENHLKAIIETEPECVSLATRDGRLREMNPAGLRMFEADSLDALRGRPLSEFVTEPFRQAFRSFHEQAFDNGGGSLLFEIIGLKGGRRWLESHVTPMRPPGGKEEALLSITRDVTDSKRVEEKLRQSEKLTAIGQLAGGIAHDFNNQLSVILGYAELISTRLQDPELERFARAILSAARTSSELTRNLLAFSRQGHFEPVPTDLHELIDEVISLVRRSVDKRIEVRRIFQAARTVVNGDPATLQNALLNLALNARDAMPQGGVLEYATDTVEAADLQPGLAPGRYLHVMVSDTGTGMSDEVRRRVFEPFFTTKPVGQGTGMGLASVFGTVSLHKGRISVDSEPGRGSIFHLYLPLVQEGILPKERAGDGAIYSRRLTILLVEDDRRIREMLKDMMASDGHEVVEADGGREAIAVYRDRWREFDLVLLDMSMPDMDGYDTFHALRDIHREVRVLLMSGYGPEGRIRALLEEGVFGLLQKPYEKAQLVRMISQAMDSGP